MAKTDRGNISAKGKPKNVVVVHKFLSPIKWLSHNTVAVSNSKWVRWSLLILLPLIVLALNHDTGADYDIWWHMALGKYYWTHHTLRVNHAIFSWTPANSGWIYNNCLGSLILYLAYNAFSGFGLWLVQWTVMIGIFALIVIYIRSQGGQLDTTIIGLIFLLFVGISIVTIVYRPELFSVFFFTLFVFLYFKGRSSSHLLYWLYPLLMILWVNLHGAFIFGIALLGLLCIGEFIEQVFIGFDPPGKERLLTLIGATVLTCAACIINPYGPDYLLSIFHNATNAEYNEQNKLIMAYGSLWPALTLGKIAMRFTYTAFIMAIFAALIVIFYIRAYVRRQSTGIAPFIACVPLFFVGMSMARACYFFQILALFTLIHLLGREDVQTIRRRLAPLMLVFYLIFGSLIGLVTFRFPQVNIWFGKNIEELIPIEEVAIIKKYHLPAPIFNDYLVGGYLLWAMYPDYKVFIDPRFGPYQQTVLPDYYDLCRDLSSEAIRKFTSKYQFKVAFLHMSQTPLIFALLTSEGSHWRLCYLGKNAVILIHDSLVGKLSPELVKINMSPLKFSNEDNPDVLQNLFEFYVRIGTIYGNAIIDIFDKNVSNRFYNKQKYMLNMIKAAEEMDRTRRGVQQAPGAIQKP